MPEYELVRPGVTILSGHVSAETAYVVEDYPYGYRLRCKIRYWIEYTPRKGCRIWSQTTNPKIASVEVWNKPKASIYSRFGMAMFINGDGHVKWSGISEYSDTAAVLRFRDTYLAGVPAGEAQELVQRWAASKLAYDARPADESMAIKAAHARVAFAKWEPQA